MQTVTVQIRIFPVEPALLREHGTAYIDTVNVLTMQAECAGTFPKLTSKDIRANLPSAIRNQVIRDASSIHKKTKKQGKRPILRRRAYYVNNQNYSIDGSTVAFPVMMDGKVQRLRVASRMTERENHLLASGKRGLLKVVEKSGKWYVQVSVEMQNEQAVGDATIRRKYSSHRRKLGKLKKLSAIRKQRNKEQRYMKDQNHKISRQIVNMAKEQQVSVIKVEKLTNIRQTTRTSRKNAKNLHNWSFYQLQRFIAYKAALAGIRVIEVNPAYTSQTCPICGKRNKAIDRMYRCSCGFHAHRDRVGAINIMRQPVADGNSLSA
ncbi:RNA-guided endonuclease InsQ/TnpB family protein [Cohnella soli]|uniref:RNA-guided endonuclease InsQ/TnpB family protein n=1 Tax=Cohnella soli TaxID=425005 RepID=A0ABW0I2X4_9BACL